MSEYPADLVDIQQKLLEAEGRYVKLVEALYGHAWMRQAREDGRLEDATRGLREVARAA